MNFWNRFRRLGWLVLLVVWLLAALAGSLQQEDGAPEPPARCVVNCL